MSRKQQGFTLIELVIVIIILGILAVTALPKFINLHSDARAATLRGLEGAIQSANAMVYSKATLAGVQLQAQTSDSSKSPSVDIGNNVKVATNYGYIPANADELQNALEIKFDTKTTQGDWVVVTSTGKNTPKSIILRQKGAPEAKGSGDKLEACELIYTEASATTQNNQLQITSPQYKIITNGC